VRDVHATTSPSMDIQISSNFERAAVRGLQARRRDRASPDGLAEAIGPFRAARCDARRPSARILTPAAPTRRKTAAAIRAALARGPATLVDPHTAVALAVADRDTSDSQIPNIVLSTAHAAKFPDAVEAACGVRPQLPAWLDGLMTRAEQIKGDEKRSGRGSSASSCK